MFCLGRFFAPFEDDARDLSDPVFEASIFFIPVSNAASWELSSRETLRRLMNLQRRAILQHLHNLTEPYETSSLPIRRPKKQACLRIEDHWMDSKFVRKNTLRVELAQIHYREDAVIEPVVGEYRNSYGACDADATGTSLERWLEQHSDKIRNYGKNKKHRRHVAKARRQHIKEQEIRQQWKQTLDLPLVLEHVGYRSHTKVSQVHMASVFFCIVPTTRQARRPSQMVLHPLPTREFVSQHRQQSGCPLNGRCFRLLWRSPNSLYIHFFEPASPFTQTNKSLRLVGTHPALQGRSLDDFIPFDRTEMHTDEEATEERKFPGFRNPNTVRQPWLFARSQTSNVNNTTIERLNDDDEVIFGTVMKHEPLVF